MARQDFSPTGTAVFGALFVVAGIGVAVFDLGAGGSRSLGVPGWLAGLLLVLCGVYLVVYGLRRRG